MHTRASNSELVEPLPEPELTLNRRLRRQNRRVPFEQRNNPPQHPRIVYPPILDINYFRHFLDILQNFDPIDDEPMWAADRVVASTPSSAITIPETANKFAIKALFDGLLREIRAFSQHENESLTDAWLHIKKMLRNCHGHNLSNGKIIKIFYQGLNEITQEVLNAAAGGIFLYKTPNQAYQLLKDKVVLKLDWAKNQKTKSSLKKTIAFAVEGSNNSDTDKIMARMDAMTMKMDAQYKDFQSRSKQSNLDRSLLTSNLLGPSGSFLSNTQPNPKGSSSKPYQPSQARNEHVNAVFTRSGKSYDPLDNPNDQQNNSKTPINFDSDDEVDEPTPQPKPKTPKTVKETPIPKPYKPKNLYPQRLKIEKMEVQYGKFLDLIRAVRINVPLIDVLARMPNYGKFLKEIINNKHKIEQMLAAFLSDESSAILQNKVPPKLRDPRSFLIPCNFNKAFSCNALADLGASINLMSIDVIDEILEEDFDALLDEEPLTDLELKPYPDNLEYVFLEETSFLPVIISSQLSEENKNKLVSVLNRHKQAFAWKTTDIPGICPSFCKHKIQLPEDKKPVVQKQRRLNPNMQEVVKKEIVKLLDTNIIYPISDSPWVSPIHCVPMKGGIKVFTNERNELIPTRTITGWRRCMLAIFHDMIEESVEVFRDDFSVFGSSFDHCLNNLDKMLQHCKDAHLVLNWEKCHFMVKEGIVLGHKVSEAGLKVDKAKIEVISKLPPPLISKLLKEKLTCVPVIVSPNWNLPFELMCYASDFAVGAILGQKDGKTFHPIYVASKTLNAAQQNYTITEKQLMVAVFAFDKF
ncbi:reverse transcriptase domain-containing protein [Tanacetum coccineum]